MNNIYYINNQTKIIQNTLGKSILFNAKVVLTHITFNYYTVRIYNKNYAYCFKNNVLYLDHIQEYYK